MRSRAWIMLVVAIAAGLLAVVVATRWMQARGSSTGQIAVANADIEIGGRISPEQVRLVDWPEANVPPGAFTAAEPLAGRVVLVSVQRGEPILAGRLAPEGTKGGLSAVVADGKRAMTVRVNDVVGVAGFALPGTFVDILVNTQDDAVQRGNAVSVSKIVLERILVLAVAQEADRDTTRPKVVNAVTLEVTPQQAELLDLTRSVGTLSLVLRNQGDPKVVATSGVTKTELVAGFGQPAPKPVAEPVAVVAPVAYRRAAPVRPVSIQVDRSNCVEVIRGLSKVTECF